MSLSEQTTIHEIVKKLKDADRLGNVKKSKYVNFNFREDLDKIDAYRNSLHISGSVDHLGREKPFFDIGESAVNIWYRATDIDRKQIKFIADKQEDVILSFLENIKLQEWMREEKFGKFLNEWGLKLATYLEAVVKFVEKDGKLHPSVIDWNNFYCDPIDFNNNVKMEALWFTPAQLRKQTSFKKELVQKLIDNKRTRKTAEGSTVDSKNEYIELYEVHGELPLSLLKASKGEEVLDGDEKKFIQQMHIITFDENIDSKDGNEDYTLFSGAEDDPYMLTSLMPNAEGSVTLNGSIKRLFEAQWMVNHSEKQIKDQLDLVSKKFWQTADANFQGKNATNDLETGDIVIHTKGDPLTELSGRPDIAGMQSNKNDWQAQGLSANGINEAMTNAPKAGTAWRAQENALQEAHSLFELFIENKGLDIEEMARRFILPFFRKKLNNKKVISGILDEHQIKFIDSRYITNEAKRRVEQIKINTILSGEIYDPSQEGELIANEEQLLQKTQNANGSQRFIKPSEIADKTWKDVFKGAENKLIVEVTGESKDIQATMATYNTALGFLANLQGREMTPEEKLIFGGIIELTGAISPIELVQAQNDPNPAPVQGIAKQPVEIK